MQRMAGANFITALFRQLLLVVTGLCRVVTVLVPGHMLEHGDDQAIIAVA